MRRVAVALLLLVWVLSVGVSSAGALPCPSSAELVESPDQFDGRTIEFTGEVVGDIMRRGDMAWIHINDDAYMHRNVEEGAPLGGYNSGHAVWLSADLAEEISYVGDYHNEGDVVTVTGEFRAACPEHGGDMDIHADSLVVVTSGHAVVDPIPGWKPWLALLLSLAAGGFFGMHLLGRVRS